VECIVAHGFGIVFPARERELILNEWIGGRLTEEVFHE
jgi:hypothetical protein